MAGKTSKKSVAEVAVRRAISRAERILPGTPAPHGKRDPRWQAIICVGEFIETQPEPVWEFAHRWGMHAQADLRASIATCLLEHLLEHHFELLFPRVRGAALESPRFADTFRLCWWFGQAKTPKNAALIKRLESQLRRLRASKPPGVNTVSKKSYAKAEELASMFKRIAAKATKPRKGEAVASKRIDQIVADSGDWRGQMLDRVRKLIKQADPNVVEERKWRKPSNGMAGVAVWSREGMICTGETYKDKVKFTFAKGAALDDPSGLFNSSLAGGTRRAIDFHQGDSINEKAFKTLIRDAVALNTTER